MRTKESKNPKFLIYRLRTTNFGLFENVLLNSKLRRLYQYQKPVLTSTGLKKKLHKGQKEITRNVFKKSPKRKILFFPQFGIDICCSLGSKPKASNVVRLSKKIFEANALRDTSR